MEPCEPHSAGVVKDEGAFHDALKALHAFSRVYVRYYDAGLAVTVVRHNVTTT